MPLLYNHIRCSPILPTLLISLQPSTMAVPKQGKPKSTLAILWQSLTLSPKNIHLSLPIFVVSTLIAFLTFTANSLASTPVHTDLLSKAFSIASVDPSTPEYSALLSAIRDDARELALFTAIFLLVAFLGSSLSTVAYVHVITISYFDKPSAIVKDFLPKLKESLKGPLITLLMVAVLHWGYFVLLLLAPGVFFALVAPGSIVFTFAGGVVHMFLILLYLYFSVLLSVGVVVSVVEPEFYGVAAISKAAEITKGRMRQGVAIVIVKLLVTCVLAPVVQYVARQTTAWQLVIPYVYLAITTVLNLFIQAGFTVFYYECLESRKDGSGYHPLPTAHLGYSLV